MEASNNKPVIFVSLAPQAFLVKAIAGPDLDVHILIESGQDPHHWLPNPNQILILSKAIGCFPSGLPFEQNFLPKIRGQQNSPQIFPPISIHSSTNDHEKDPHIWLSPPLLIEQTTLIAESLKQLKPDNASLYKNRAEALKIEIAALHYQLTGQLAPHKGRSFLIFHNALGHFARTYDLSQNVIQSGGAPPDPKRLRQIIKQAKLNRTSTVIIQPQFDNHSARMIAEAIGGRVVIIDPLAEDVLANLKHIADTLTDAFSQSHPLDQQQSEK